MPPVPYPGTRYPRVPGAVWNTSHSPGYREAKLRVVAGCVVG